MRRFPDSELPRWWAVLDAYAAHPWAVRGRAGIRVVAEPPEFPGRFFKVATFADSAIARYVVAMHNARLRGETPPQPEPLDGAGPGLVAARTAAGGAQQVAGK